MFDVIRFILLFQMLINQKSKNHNKKPKRQHKIYFFHRDTSTCYSIGSADKELTL
jgi:hypothetical protein